jgi:hypothetical protein
MLTIESAKDLLLIADFLIQHSRDITPSTETFLLWIENMLNIADVALLVC